CDACSGGRFGAGGQGPERCPACSGATTSGVVKRFETRSRPCPPSIIGQRVAFHQAARRPQFEHIGAYKVCRANAGGRFGITPTKDRWDLDDWAPLPLGAVLGTGIIAASYPIVGEDGDLTDVSGPCIERRPEGSTNAGLW